MSLTGFWRLFGWFDRGVQVETVTLRDIELRLEMEARAAEIIRYGIGYIPAPPGALVIDNTTSTVEQARNAGMLVVGETIYDASGYVPAAEWKRLDADGEKYLAGLTPMKRDPETGRPVRG